jgi:hypothetical protein
MFELREVEHRDVSIGGVLLNEVLMVDLGEKIFRQGHYLSHDGSLEHPGLIQLSDVGFGDSFLFRIGDE